MEEGDITVPEELRFPIPVEIKYRPIWFIPWYVKAKIFWIKSYTQYTVKQNMSVKETTIFRLDMNDNYKDLPCNSKIIIDGMQYSLNENTLPLINHNIEMIRILSNI